MAGLNCEKVFGKIEIFSIVWIKLVYLKITGNRVANLANSNSLNL